MIALVLIQVIRETVLTFDQTYKRTNDTLETTIIHLFEKGVTMSEIADLIEKMYGHHYTPQTMSNMTKVLTEEVNAT